MPCFSPFHGIDVLFTLLKGRRHNASWYRKRHDAALNGKSRRESEAVQSRSKLHCIATTKYNVLRELESVGKILCPISARFVTCMKLSNMFCEQQLFYRTERPRLCFRKEDPLHHETNLWAWGTTNVILLRIIHIAHRLLLFLRHRSGEVNHEFGISMVWMTKFASMRIWQYTAFF